MNGWGWTLSSMLVVYLIAVEPLWGRHEYQRAQRRSATDTQALVRLYRLTVTVEWAWVGVLGVLVAVGGVAVGSLIIPPERLKLPGVVAEIGPGLVIGMIGGLVLGGVAVAIAAMRQSNSVSLPNADRFDALIPRLPRERRWFAAVAVTAGICEELVFRGFLTYYLAALVSGADALLVVVLAAGIFGVAHAYQGVAGVATTSVMGFVLGLVYLATGSLIPGMVVHALVDMRILIGPRPHEPLDGRREDPVSS